MKRGPKDKLGKQKRLGNQGFPVNPRVQWYKVREEKKTVPKSTTTRGPRNC